MSIESDILIGLAGLLNTAGVGVYNAAGGYQPTDTAIVFGELPTSPNRVVALTLYTSSDEIKQNLSEYRVQLMFRGAANNSLDVGDLASSCFVALQGTESVEFGSVHVIQIYRTSFVPQGLDSNKRSERADNYVVQVNTPTTPGRNGF